MGDISIDVLLEEQKRSGNRVVIRGIPGDNEQVKVTPVIRGMKCACRDSQIVPRSAIKSITKTGKSLHCCNETLQIVEVEFSHEKLITYDELFKAVRSAHAATMGSIPRRRNRPVARRRPHILQPLPVIPVDPGDGGGGDDSDETYDDCIEDCITELILYEMPEGLSPAAEARYWITAYNDCKRGCL